ncbi:MAG: type III toxin-antitoxin system ToxN/AbiQ family toxin, partial [Lachnospiraceae bacterium]|nr:type III toxin-antitoxin system ToxN/AbiQ family toxin [Lachnospiraceae bacterium]
FSRMFDKGNKLIGCLNFNNMLPVDDSVLLPIDMRVQKGDSAKERAYKALYGPVRRRYFNGYD